MIADRGVDGAALTTSDAKRATSHASTRADRRVTAASFGQASLWFLRQLMPYKSAYNTAVHFRLEGDLDAPALEAALREIVRRHESFRTTFALAEGTVVQIVHQELSADVATVDLSSSPDPEGEARRLSREMAALPFDLDHGPLLGVRLLRLSPRAHLLVVVMDHIVADGMSLGILWREMEALYRAFHAGSPSPLPPPARQYADCVTAQNHWLTTAAFARQLRYWTDHLAGAAAADLPADRPRPAVRTFRGDLAVVHLPAPLTARLRALAARDEVSLFAALLAGLDVLVARTSGQRDVVVMIPIACRQRFAADAVIGFFANMVVLRNDVPDDVAFRTLVQRVNKEIMAGVMRQDVPFEKVVEALRPDRSLSHDPLARIALSFLPAQASALDLPGVVATYGEIPNGGAKFDLHFVISEHPDDLTCSVEYNTDVFDRETIEALLDQYRLLLDGAGAEPERAVADLTLIAPEQRERLVRAWNDTRAEYPRRATIPELFAATAAHTPEATALSCGEDAVTYRELDRRSDRIARCLRARGVRAGALVGVAVERSTAMVAGLLGILKAGGAYVPLDPAYPRERLALMASDSGLAVLLTEDRYVDLIPTPGGGLLRLDGDRAEIDAQPEGPLGEGPGAEHVAYVIYTSGSTGRPKGVQIPHRAVVNFLATMRERPGLLPSDRLLAVTSLSFDIAGLELWLPLTLGAHVEIAGRETAQSGAALRRRLESGQITVIQATPSTFRLLIEAGWAGSSGLRVLIGGEAVPRDLADELIERSAAVWNMYGPTETTIWSCVHRLDRDGPVLIGRPIANTQVHVLDRRFEPAPVGVPGELYIGGDGVAHGYLGRPDLTAERFIPDPFSSGQRLYRTGDLCRWRRDGALEFMGRLDHQLKIRGYRIELGEIEAALTSHPAVQQAVVVARDDGASGKRLVAYSVPANPGVDLTAAELRAHLAAKLPEYMVPAAFVTLAAVPLLPNGKIDRRSLPAPGDGHPTEAAFVAPRTPAEEVLAGIWADVLDLDRVSVVDDFFALGGHSLLGMRVLARLGTAFGVELPLRALFEARTVALLAGRIDAARATGAAPAALPPLTPVPRDHAPRLSFAQQRLWFLDRLEPNNIAYNLPTALFLSGALEAGALEQALGEIVRRHESLRTTFSMADGEPRQIIATEAAFSMPVVDLGSLPEGEREPEALRRASADAQRPFDLARGPLFRATLYRLSADHHLLLVCAHHVVSDGWSEGVLGRELSALYRTYAQGLPPALPALPIQPADHAAWQRTWLTGKALDDQLAYWKDKLRGAPAAIDLPTDRPRPPLQSTVGTVHPFTLPPELRAALGALARREGATLFMVLLAAFQALLARYSGQSDVVVGSPIAGRTHPRIEPLVGFFVGTLVLRTDLGDDPSVRALLGRVRETTLDAYAHQDVPFEKLVEALSPPRDLSRSPLFQAMLILQNAPPAPPSLGEVALRRVEVERGTSKFDLTLVLEETADGALTGFLEYPTALFDAGRVARMAGHLRTLLEAAVADPTRRVSELPLLTPAERDAILVTWNDTARPHALDLCLHERFAAQAEATPEAVALEFEGRVLDYRTLRARARRVASHLASFGAGPGRLVGLSMDRSPAMVVGLLGILEAGAAYVPLDPTYPADRIAFVLQDAGIEVLVSEAGIAEGLPQHRAQIVLLDTDGGIAGAEAPSSPGGPGPVRRVTPDDRAYVIYTSGSTGRPKGVEVSHRAVVNFLATMAERPGCTASDHLLAVTSLSFDIAGLELWLPLTVGARVEIASRATATDGAALRKRLDSPAGHGGGDLRTPGPITLFQATPSTFRLLVESGWTGRPELKVLVGGEAVPPELAEALVDRAGSVWNMYGPTETTIWSAIRKLEKGAPVLIGHPIANTQTYVLDRRLAPVPIGVPGELYIGGTGVARGYLGRPELTAERFVPDPFGATLGHDGGRPPMPPGARLYRTGDLCRQRPDGALEFLGRVDFQVKIRGHRIELGEIEANLAQHAEIRQAVVVAWEESPGDQRLVAYVTSKDGATPAAADLRAHLAARLPDYMVPSRFLQIDALPLTSNGKIDRKALPPPGKVVVAGGAAPDESPREAIEYKLRAIWEELLGVQGIGVRDNFFDLGGHSLLAVKLFDRIERTCGINLPIASLFQAPTIAGLAQLLRREGWTPSWSSLVPIHSAGRRAPFFCVHAVGGNVLNYRLLSRYLGEDLPFYGLQSRGLGGNEAPHTTVEEMAAAYIDEMREERPHGPYQLGGASSGGVVAYEMAQQLHAAGERVSALILMDTYIAGPPPARVVEARAASPVHQFAMTLDHHLGHLLLRTPRQGYAYLADRVRARLGGVADPTAAAIHVAPPAVRHVIESNLQALSNYVPRPYPGSATMLLSRDEPDRAFYDTRLAWTDLLGEPLMLRFIPGNHENMLDEPTVAGVAAVIDRCLAPAP